MSDQNLKVSVIVPVYNNALYLLETLESLERQTLKNFEVIVVNDGSTDESEKIIDLFVKKDQRFRKISQENKGVSAARNAALNIAKGKYVTFVDGDDTLPKNSLRQMSRVAEKFKSDLVIGGIQRVDGFTKKVNQRTQNLGKKDTIRKDDLDLVHGLSLCNKWFLKEIIDKQQIRLEKFRHLEDGVFLYNFLQYADRIHFCDEIIYNYLKRIPTNGGSVTQKVEKGLLENAIKAFERLQELTLDYSDAFKAELAYRINSTTFIGDYYKKIWYLDEATEKKLISCISEIWESQSEEHKKRTRDSHPGLELEKGVRSKEELLEDCVFTIIISPGIEKQNINVILKSIYGQAVPAFRVILDESYEECVENAFQNMKNLRFQTLGNDHQDWIASVQKDDRTRYVTILDQGVIFDYDTLAKAYKIFEKKKCTAVKVSIVQSEKTTGLSGQIFDIKKCKENEMVVIQKDAPMIALKDMGRVQELTRPTALEYTKKILKITLKKVLKQLNGLLR